MGGVGGVAGHGVRGSDSGDLIDLDEGNGGEEVPGGGH